MVNCKGEFVIIECRGLTKRYDVNDAQVTAVDSANLQMNRKDFAVILGHSGSGKTTLLSLIGGLTKPDSGTVFVNGRDNWLQNDNVLSSMRCSDIGFIFQFASLVPSLTVIENVLLPLTFSRKPAGDRSFALEILERVGLADKAGVFPSQLSGGQQRRVAIARAFVNRPAIILADEPTGDLDEETEQEILGLFRHFNEQGTTFVVVTHNTELAESQASPRIFQMRQGILEEQAA